MEPLYIQATFNSISRFAFVMNYAQVKVPVRRLLSHSVLVLGAVSAATGTLA